MLILDEPTSMLTPQAVRELQAVLERLKAHGLAIVFITHKLHEAVALGDRISVLRARPAHRRDRARAACSAARRRELESEIVRLMFGEALGAGEEVAELRIGVDGRRRARDAPTPRSRSSSTTPTRAATARSRGSRTSR